MTRIRSLTGILTATAVLAAGVTLSAAQDSRPASTPAAGKADAAPKKVDKSMLMEPSKLTEQAPATFKARLETSKGNIVIEVQRDWSPNGADRFYNLVKNGFLDDVRFFRVVPNFMVQFGINGDQAIQQHWRSASINDDTSIAAGKKQSNKRGYVTFAKTGAPNSRSTQIFINFKDNSFLDSQGFTPFGQVIEGMEIVDKIEAKHGEKPDQMQIQSRGNEYLNASFPGLDFVKSASIVK